jgi:hypothetical protein
VIAYVASTLPIALLDKKLADWGVEEIILQGAAHQASYAYLKARHPLLDLHVLPRAFFFNTLALAWILAKLRWTHGRVFFFHECCCPVFDILIKLFQPPGSHYPQVTLGGFERVSSDVVFPTKLHRLICFFGLKNLFDYYRGDNENKEGYFFVQVTKSYPSSIERHEVMESRQLLLESISRDGNFAGTKKIIILCGRDIVEDKELAKIYVEIIDLANSLGFMCYLKDHPSAVARLNVRNERAEVIDPAMPLELVEDDFALAIGVASTGLLHFSTRAISIIKLLPVGEEGASIRRIAHLVSMPGGEAVQFPDDLHELQGIFIKTAHT